VAEAKKRQAKGTKKGKRKAPAKRRQPKAEKRTPEEIREDGQAVAADVATTEPDPETLPWAHLADEVAVVDDKETGRRSMTALEITQRNGQIFRSWLRGLRVETLAETYGLKPRAIEKILAQWKEHGGAVIGQDPMQIIEDHVLRLDAVVDELAAVAAKEKGSGRVAAIRARLEAMKAKIEFLQQVKILPQDLGTIGVQIDLRAVGLLLYEALEKRGLAEPELMGELADIIEGKRTPEGNTIELDADGKPKELAAA
jgi:hypothetical protein